ncbi:MAG: HAD hydrolase-like protein [Ktedonobacteraceae bacterium]|nr:HAD hydrolase-like protein [Ktedonobacteraceae bacterium]
MNFFRTFVIHLSYYIRLPRDQTRSGLVPYPGAFFNALTRLDHPKMVYMIGDNIEADVLGAEAVGIPAILVRNPDSRAIRFCPDLFGIPNLLSRGFGQD